MRYLSAFLIACALLLAAGPAAAKSYTVQRVQSDVVLEPDGTLRFTEQLTFQYQGRFKFAFRNIPLKSGERLSDVRVSEGGTEYKQSKSERAGNFRVRERGGEQRITWYYRARNEQRTFTLQYTLRGATKRHPDISEVYVQFVGDQWDRPIGEVVATLRLPDSIDPGEVRAWAHGPLHGRIDGVGTRRLKYTVSPLPAQRFWEGRVVLPGDAFANLPVEGTSPRLDAIIAEEAAWAADANRRREVDEVRAAEAARKAEERESQRLPFLLVATAFGLLALAVWFMLFMSHGKAHDVRPMAPPGEAPSEHPPALLSYLLHRSVFGRAVVATLLDLAHRGYFEIREKAEEKTGWLGHSKTQSDFLFERTPKDASDLAPYESELLSFLLKEAGTTRGFSMSGLKAVARKRSTAFHKWFVAWIKRVKKAGTAAKFFEPYPVRPMVLNAIMGVIIAAAGLFMCIYNDSAVGVPAIIGGVVQAVLTGSLTRHTPQGRRLVLEWRAFKRHLESITKGLGPVTLDSQSWGRYLAAALIFGMHKKLLPHLRVETADGRGAVYPVWYHAAVQANSGEGLSGLSAGFSSMVDAVSSGVSSASGTSSGGASGGGGGGSGGGGGGAG